MFKRLDRMYERDRDVEQELIIEAKTISDITGINIQVIREVLIVKDKLDKKKNEFDPNKLIGDYDPDERV